MLSSVQIAGTNLTYAGSLEFPSITQESPEETQMVAAEETLDVREGLLRMRDDQLRKLVEMASDRKAAERVYQQILLLEKAIAPYEAPAESYKYAKHKSVIHAILDYLEEVGHPTTEEEIIKALIKGSFRRGDDPKKIAANIKQSIASFTADGALGHKTKQIKQINGLVGKGNWTKEMFKQP